MSWMRSPVYCWGDGKRVHLWARRGSKAMAFHPDGSPDPVEDDCDYPDFTGGLSMPYPVFDALVLYRAAELANNPVAFAKAVKQARKGAGNFGADAFFEAIDLAKMNENAELRSLIAEFDGMAERWADELPEILALLFPEAD